MCQIFRVTEEAQVAETAAWPIPFLIDMFTAHKGSKFYFYFQEGSQYKVLSRWNQIY